jgi:hypothetical protein
MSTNRIYATSYRELIYQTTNPKLISLFLVSRASDYTSHISACALGAGTGYGLDGICRLEPEYSGDQFFRKVGRFSKAYTGFRPRKQNCSDNF